ncbi:hypothetical protein SLS56_010582 [Neofusicoccum ribis]|uniref:Uncharacterized protein n=1 Tax=Neofusicoccum ribis TaxID=45134 RepID=A0ABR3SEF6_9PEZI
MLRGRLHREQFDALQRLPGSSRRDRQHTDARIITKVNNADESPQSDVLLYFLALFVPPVPVFIKRGCGADFLINICLSILGWIPGVILRNLALQYPGSALNTGPLLIYLTARDTSRGQAALDALHQDAQLLKAKVLSAQGGPVSLTFHQLDISSPTSIDAFAATLAHTHGQIDIVINNAGIALDGFSTSPPPSPLPHPS